MCAARDIDWEDISNGGLLFDIGKIADLSCDDWISRLLVEEQDRKKVA